MTSKLARIEVPVSWGPFDLMRNWIKEYKLHSNTPSVMFNLATASRVSLMSALKGIFLNRENLRVTAIVGVRSSGLRYLCGINPAKLTGEPKNRFVDLHKFTDDGIIFITNPNSPKAQHISDNPKVAASFLFTHKKNESQCLSRQIRIEGIVEEEGGETIEEFFESQPLYAKIRSILIPEQSVRVNWDELNEKHDILLEKVQNGQLQLIKPKTLVAYRIRPRTFDFYYASQNEIADRIIFEINPSGKWTYNHLTA